MAMPAKRATTRNKRGEEVLVRQSKQREPMKGGLAPLGSEEQERRQKEAAKAWAEAEAERKRQDEIEEAEGKAMTQAAVFDIKEHISARMRDVPHN
jgi:hypothetical protein